MSYLESSRLAAQRMKAKKRMSAMVEPKMASAMEKMRFRIEMMMRRKSAMKRKPPR